MSTDKKLEEWKEKSMVTIHQIVSEAVRYKKKFEIAVSALEKVEAALVCAPIADPCELIESSYNTATEALKKIKGEDV